MINIETYFYATGMLLWLKVTLILIVVWSNKRSTDELTLHVYLFVHVNAVFTGWVGESGL